MAETKDWVFIFPIIAAAVLLISLIFPIMSVSIYYPGFIDPAIVGNLLPFGGGIMDELAPYLLLVPEDISSLQMGFLVLRIAFIVFFILGALLLIISGIRVKTGRKELKKARRKWLRNGLSYIISEIILYLSLVYGVPYGFQQLGIPLETGFSMGIGMILIIVAGGVLVFGYIMAKIKTD